MGKHKRQLQRPAQQNKILKDVPWTSFGRETVATRVGRSLVPVGIYPFELQPSITEDTPSVDVTAKGTEEFLLNVIGTAIQVGDGKLLTCNHVVEALFEREKKRSHYILSRLFRGNTVYAIPYPIQASVPYIDIRTSKPNPEVDLAALAALAASTDEIPYEVPHVKWGDSTRLGVGDQVILGGYAYGKQMFLFTESNRGLIQPTFYSGIISAILPATTESETRLLQLNIPAPPSMSGGAVFLPKTGEIIGMVTGGIKIGEIPLPMSYAIPSEVLAPFAENLGFKRGPRGNPT
jgi:S1-C subfamily serine protease